MNDRKDVLEVSAPLNIEDVIQDEAGATGIKPGGDLPVGLALSGGGIRSATFALGIIQALAAKKKLASFDYLSTVSGGGYIGGFLSAWIFRSSLEDVQKKLALRGISKDRKANEADEISWLRRYSNYLAPRIGLLSIDSLTLITIWVRNVVLSLITLTAMIAVVLMAPWFSIPVIDSLVTHRGALGSAAAFFGIVFFPLAVVGNFLHLSRNAEQRTYWLISTPGVLLTVIAPAAVAAAGGSVWLFGVDPGQSVDVLVTFWRTMLFLTITGAVWIGWQFIRAPARGIISDAAVFAFSATMSVMVAFGLLGIMRNYANNFSDFPRNVWLLVFGIPIFFATFGICGSIYVGLVGRVFREPVREWWSRLNAWLLIIGLIWFSVMWCVFYLAPIVEWASTIGFKWVKVASFGWLFSLISTIFSDKVLSRVSKSSGAILIKALNVAAFIVILGYVAAVAVGIDRTLGVLNHQPSGTEIQTPHDSARTYSLTQKNYMARFELYLDSADSGLSSLTTGFGLTVCVLLLFGWRVDVNKFSLHNMYKNRLIRCYLGASKSRRNPHPFIGLDPDYDIPLSELAAQRPLHILNTTLNLTQGRNIAWQERKSASFIFTPRSCGYSLAGTQGDTTISQTVTSSDQQSIRILDAEDSELTPIPAFRPTADYAKIENEDAGFTLGMAMATSGAAVSPNMGSNTSPLLSFVMTLFNARLGRWSPNPAQRYWKLGSPRFGLSCLMLELFGMSNELRSFVYLSDGGHFDNMGLYELVRRKCRVIWLVDASADPRRTFSDFGRSIRQCRIDFGVEITLPLQDLCAVGSALPSRAFVAGEIHYDDASEGKIVYIKPTICDTRNEPDDVLAFAARHPDFPHQSTSDQFFEESQFESYRRLGLHIGEECLRAHENMLPSPPPARTTTEQNPVDREKPHSLLKWLIVLTLITIAGGVCLNWTKCYLLPETTKNNAPFIPFFYSNDTAIASYRCNTLQLLSEGQISLPECQAKNISPSSMRDSAASRIKETAAMLEIPDNVSLWLWGDNFWIVSYTAMFIIGFVRLRLAVDLRFRHPAVIFMQGISLLLIFTGAASDYLENFILLGGVRASPEMTQLAVDEAVYLLPWKINLFMVNALLFAAGLGVVAFLNRKPHSQ